MKKHNLILMVCIVLLIIGSAFVASATASAETMSGILIVPFNIHAEKDQSFLKPAITDMLYTRLSAENRTIIVEKGARTDSVSAADAVSMGRQQNVDYVLFGSITMLGTMISTDARLVGVAREKSLLTFNEVGQDQGDIIAHIDHLTTRINETIFGVVKPVVPPPVSDPASDDIHTHPEKLVIPGMAPQTSDAPAPSATPAPVPPSALSPSTAPVPTPVPAPSMVQEQSEPPAPAMVMATGMDKDETLLSFWKSESFSAAFDGISIADIDGDGSNEIVCISRNQVYVYRYQNGRLQEILTFSHKSFTRLIHVDTADINQNGTAEIFVTDYVSSQQRVRSMVLEWNGQDFDIIDDRIDWYLRILQTPASEPLLLGQKRGAQPPQGVPVTIQDVMFDRDVHEIRYQDGHYASAGLYVLPKGLSLYDFARGDASNNGQNEIVSFLRSDHINIYNQNGEIAWESDKTYGGNRLFLEAPDPENPFTDSSRTRRTIKYYLPQRIHVTDIDRDGLNEIIILSNWDNDTSIFSRIRAFKEGHFDCLSYDDIGTQLKWQTRNIAGYISDYVIGDLNNDGINEIVLSTVAKGKSLLSKGKSYIMSIMPISE